METTIQNILTDIETLEYRLEEGVITDEEREYLKELKNKLKKYPFQKKEKTYIMIWIDEEEKWYYFTENFDKKQFFNGFVDYYIIVDREGYIIKDTFNRTREGKKFTEEYNILNWENN